jgi:hypothetical protein
LADLDQSLEWPDIGICMEPLFKNKNLFEEFHSRVQRETFTNMDEFQNEVDQVFFKAEDIIQAVLIGDNYLDAVKPNGTKFEIKSPLVTTYQVDYQRNGACAVLSLEIAKKMMIENGYDQYSKEKDSDFTAIIYLKVCFLSVRRKIPSALPY